MHVIYANYRKKERTVKTVQPGKDGCVAIFNDDKSLKMERSERRASRVAS
jgi:hypothetical protein